MRKSEYLLFGASSVALCSEYLSSSHSRAGEKEGIDLKLLSGSLTLPIKCSFLQDLFLHMQGAVKVFYKNPFSVNFGSFSLVGSKILSVACWGG